MIGIGFGAAKLFGELGLKIYWGNCAHGMEPRIYVENITVGSNNSFGNVLGVYKSNTPQYTVDDVEYMPFGIFTGYPTVHQGFEDLDAVARFNNDRGYAPIVREQNAVLVGFSPHAEDWSELFCNFVEK